MTGGTVLSEFYFKHRYSEDLDFFSENKFDSKKVMSAISKIGDKLNLNKIEQQNLTGQNTFYLYSTPKKFVKIDFSEFPFLHLGIFKKFNNLRISSVEDIAVNKLHAITTRQRSRDYFDLYLCLKQLKWKHTDLLKNYRLKFDVILPIEQLITSYVNVVQATDLPIFLGNAKWKEVKAFFLHEANGLKGEILN
ncbi:hypothetical protein A2422_01880 [Candidatus Woesebacteria bacterium RIFOXYC1_FULL_31_51]|uniref:Nucleotidyl transferase AbiEii toxin, Type IV TA system n=1 Tax=Candidatus Woesebacteria bacterium GW2011_GWC2_31_9 TaxID=1618586 RepID=A0A0F9YK70_9BACT|nr:MAG: hypothetical protein UR17_C0001G0834 [Candidatus Woesebacteria bacterium GW2011_GWF1_31_35]KKP23621.1 MAG: hypothetical protein UR11_C0001G0595 [Candidatus Woesebacteria bacterium GW2011_GWC1_30_29]KKP26998.1 MAG: hypothetical protein UR13_C0001G0093 [Candidatus Woesebacteria bacterium GW2011_GWD1_31_12]KKP27896.1 MAG: hypothetical protein UR16_C0002G0226 [Candidatus Woesebacteria bacterium GW2011_GWB1_31_29]KKP31899.1 MAG: hypothetical protein UR21_C0004G0035 [Candidatus Woesebacteria 